MLEHDVVVLAGGRGSRLGGVDKARLQVGGHPLLEHVLAATGAARRVVVVGAVQVPDGVLRTLEDPPGGGPVAGIVAGLGALSGGGDPGPARSPSWVVVTAVDQPGAAVVVPTLLAEAAEVTAEVEAVCHLDESGHPQWLLAAYRRPALEHALAPHGTGHGVAVRRVVGALRFAHLPPTADAADLDTWADHAQWERRWED